MITDAQKNNPMEKQQILAVCPKQLEATIFLLEAYTRIFLKLKKHT